MVNDLQRNVYRYLSEIAKPVDRFGREYIVDPLNKLMPGQWGSRLAHVPQLAAEMSPAGDVMDWKRGGSNIYEGAKSLNPWQIGQGVGEVGMGTIGMIPFGGDLAKLSGLGLAGIIADASKGQDAVKASRTDTPEFKNWFGESKVVDEAGQPLTVYHGTADDVGRFSLGHHNRKDSGWLGEGFYTTDNPGIASSYANLKAGSEAPNIMPLNISLSNPYYASIDEKMAISKRGKAGAQEFTDKLRSMGHDGVILKYGGDGASDLGNREFVVFEPNQIKSIHNQGTYSKTTGDILRGLAPIGVAAGLGATMVDPWAVPEDG